MKFLNYEMGTGVCAFSTLRAGGCSRGAYASFNVNAWCGDDEGCVARNRKLLCGCLGMPEERLVIPHQVHQARVACIDELFLDGDEAMRRERLEGVDAVATDCPRVCVGVSTADCIPVLLYDKRHHAVAAVHAGWRGTVLRIAEVTLATMCEAYGTEPAEVRAVIGPGISLDAFEVGDEVYDVFAGAGFPMDRIARRFPVAGMPETEKWHIDLWEANRWTLMQAGLSGEYIHVSGVCTYDKWSDFFSARRLGLHSGRILTGIFLDR
ncbi:MAG: peptidoglycan editing factor PgeF [Paraprevotella sp.]|nr:peptidoglycan editing factor PgeF [Paraprevotella sp.]